jgi:hypothetical protein
MNKSLLLPALLVSLLLPALPAGAKAYFAGKKEMVGWSVAIAVVEVGKVEEVDAKGEHWTYRQRATAKVSDVLKGELPKEITLYGAETFICAQCKLAEGKHLIFLKKDGDKWVGSNWQLSVRPITDDKVEWYVDGKSALEQKPAPFKDVLAEVRKLVNEEPKTDPVS